MPPPGLRGGPERGTYLESHSPGAAEPRIPRTLSGFWRERVLMGGKGASGARGGGWPSPPLCCGRGECCLPAPPAGPLHLEWQSCQQDNWHFCGCDW